LPQPSPHLLGVLLVGCADQTIGTNREENFSAKRAPSLEATWISPTDVDQGRPSCAVQPSPPRSHQTISLIEPLRSRASFALLSEHGRRNQGRWCWVRYAPLPTSSDQAIPQVGYAISKKIGNAVVRNRIRRRLRPLVAAEAASLAPGVYLMGVKNQRAAWISHEELRDDVHTVLVAASRHRS